MDYKIRIVRYLYYFSLTALLILYLFPGSLIGYFLYGDLGKQPDMIPNPIGTSINHTLAFFYLTAIGLISHINQTSFIKKLQDNNFLCVKAAENVVRLLPPLNVTKQEINLGLKILDKVCKNYR